MHKALHSRYEIDYVSRKEGRKALARFESSMDASIQDIEDFIKKQRKINYSSQLQLWQNMNK